MFKYRYGTIFREIFHAEFDICLLSEGKSDNLVIKTFRAIIEKSAPGIFQGCPFETVSLFRKFLDCINFASEISVCRVFSNT